MKTSPIRKIQYDANGYDELSDKQIRKKRARWAAKSGEAVAAEYERQMLRLRDFGQALDAAFDFIAPMYERWGSINPADVVVRIESEPFDVPGANLKLAAYTGTVLPDKRTIKAVFFWVHPNGTIQNACDLARWEIGNLHYWRLIGNFDGVHEIGDSDPRKQDWIKPPR